MRRGLVIGKFLPVHEGHLALINFAASQCDELIVSMSYTPNDAIDPQLRFSWIKEIFKARPNIKPRLLKDDFDDETLPLASRTKIWADIIRKAYPTVDVIFSSEDYGDLLAKNLGAKHILFDKLRTRYPVSATLVREKPFTVWPYIPTVVRPYFVKNVCFYGPESTGKTQLAGTMARKYKTEVVPEVARELISSNDFSVEEIIKIGIAHYERIQQKLKTAHKILFCDTDAITTQIYSQYYLNEVPAVLFELEQKVKFDHYFLFNIDVPWVADGLRDLPHKREEMFAIFKQTLDKRNLSYTIISGSWSERERKVMDTLRQMFFYDIPV